MSRRYTTTLMINEGNEATVSFSVAWGSPGSGTPYFGPPENYDPGSPDAVEDVRVEMIGDVTASHVEAKAYAAEIMADADHLDELLAHAREVEADDADRAEEARYEARRDAWEKA